MVSIKIEVSGNEYEVNIPQSWNEVPEGYYPELARLYVAGPERMNEHDKLVRVFCLLALEAWEGVKQLDSYQLSDLLPVVHWVFGDLNLTVNKIKAIYPRRYLPDGGKKKSQQKQKWLGPDDGLDNLRFGEFCMAETYFMQYTESKDEKILDKLIAVLYRPHGVGNPYFPGDVSYRGDRRERFNSSLTDDRAKLLADYDLATKDGIYLFYASARTALFQYFPNVFRKKKSSAGSSASGVDFGWMGVFDDLLGEKGRTSESLEDEFVSTVLMSLERAQLRHNESKKKRR